MEHTVKDKRAAIMKAAMELIVEHGFHGAPTAMIAERAGVAIGSIYRYFENKEAVIIAVEMEVERAAMDEITRDCDCERPLREQYFYIAQRMLGFMISHPLEFRYVEQFYNSPYGGAFRRDRRFARPESGGCERDILKELYEKGRSQQIIKNLDPSVFFSLAFATLFNIARDHIAGFIRLDDEKIETIVRACWDAIRL
jgi:AcrR family transcriptional regulator